MLYSDAALYVYVCPGPLYEAWDSFFFVVLIWALITSPRSKPISLQLCLVQPLTNSKSLNKASYRL